MKYRPYAPELKFIPADLVRELVEKGLDQPKPTRGLQAILQVILQMGEHRDRLR